MCERVFLTVVILPKFVKEILGEKVWASCSTYGVLQKKNKIRRSCLDSIPSDKLLYFMRS